MSIEERRRVEEDISRLFTLSVDLLCIAGFDGYFKRLNPAWEKALGFPVEELLNKPYLDLVHPEDQRSTVSEVRNLAAGRLTISFENRFLCKDGSYRWLTWTAHPSPEEGLIYAAARDITERKMADARIAELHSALERQVAELNAVNRELEAFSYSVSHDLRAPLRHIDGFSRLLEEECGTQLGEAAREYLQRIRRGTHRMGELVDDLLHFARIGRQQVRRQRVDLNVFIEDVRRDLREQADMRKVDRRVEWRIGALPCFECDPALIKQVFANLLSNAVKYTRKREQALIEVGMLDQDGQRVLFVRDNGVGFSMKYADKLFGVFQRLHRQDEFEGTGVGLATVHRILQKHGGRIWADAKPDQGACFYFTIGAPDAIPELNSPDASPAASGAAERLAYQQEHLGQHSGAHS